MKPKGYFPTVPGFEDCPPVQMDYPTILAHNRTFPLPCAFQVGDVVRHEGIPATVISVTFDGMGRVIYHLANDGVGVWKVESSDDVQLWD